MATQSIELLSLFSWLDQFFFGSVSTLPLAYFRIALGAIIAIYTWRCSSQFSLYIGEQSLYPNSIYLKATKTGFSLFDLFPDSKSIAYVLPFLLIVSSLLFSIGFMTPVTTTLTYVLWLSLNRRVNILRSSGDALITIFLFYFIFSAAGETLSWDRWLRDQTAGMNETAVAWPLRLMQIQLCVIYIHAYNRKIMSKNWRSGRAIPNAISWPNWGKPQFRKIIQDPLFGQTLTMMTLCFQLLIPIFLWPQETRMIAVFCGLSMHLGMILCLHLEEFGPLMLASYLLFYDERIVHSALNLAGL